MVGFGRCNNGQLQRFYGFHGEFFRRSDFRTSGLASVSSTGSSDERKLRAWILLGRKERLSSISTERSFSKLLKSWMEA